MVPSRGYELPPVVGIGGSAGSIGALTEFFRATPPDTGFVFVVVLHLSPSHDSTLASLLAATTPMPVAPALHGARIEADHVYVIPPGKYLTAVDGRLRLADVPPEGGKNVAVDLFFRSLADTHGAHAMGIVLSGADGDGALGIKRIKERGGLTVAQDPVEAEHDGMPRAAIETGMVDWVLRVAEIPARLQAYMRQERRVRLPPEQGPPIATTAGDAPAADADEAALHDVLTFLRTRTGRNFDAYKRATVLRRIARRMQVNSVDSLGDYVLFLRTHPGETGTLLSDLLISVTNFFRDREAFEALERLVPRLFEGRSASDSVRVWVPACATGEEAYSIAMLLLEHAHTCGTPVPIQVFGCDLSEEAIRTARLGHYPNAITADVSEDRLKRFFVKEPRGYRVRRELRETVLFAVHDLLQDAPFSRMDLISCRNLLIYLKREAQERALETFHFSLKPGGRLFLGSSEAVDEASPLFHVVDKKHRIYLRQPSVRGRLPVPMGVGSTSRSFGAGGRLTPPPPIVHGKSFALDPSGTFHGNVARTLDHAALADLHFGLVEAYAPPFVVVNADHDIIHISISAGRFLRFSGGEPTASLLRAVDPAIRSELRAALFRAAETGQPAATPRLTVQVDGQPSGLAVTVAPGGDGAPGYLLVLFTASDAPPAPARAPDDAALEPAARQLERELEQVTSQLRETVEQHEASTEELKASNEELQAMNEELRSATEELETSREELQSINEELSTVNQEMDRKVEELASANADLQNLMASTSIATLFLDRDLKIMRYTPNSARLFNLIPSDVGRPLEHLRHHLDYPTLLDDARAVLRTLDPTEREVQDGERWFLSRLQPYRTLDDHIGGAVLTLVDVTDRHRATEALRESEERLRMLVESAKDYAIFTIRRDRTIDSWNSGAEAMFGYTADEILGRPTDALFTAEDLARGDPENEVRLALTEGRAENERWHVRKDGTLFYGSGSVMALRDGSDGPRGLVKILRDLTDQKRSEETLRESLDEMGRFNSVAVGREARMIELKEEVNALLDRLGEAHRYSMQKPEPTRRST